MESVALRVRDRLNLKRLSNAQFRAIDGLVMKKIKLMPKVKLDSTQIEKQPNKAKKRAKKGARGKPVTIFFNK